MKTEETKYAYIHKETKEWVSISVYEDMGFSALVMSCKPSDELASIKLYGKRADLEHAFKNASWFMEKPLDKKDFEIVEINITYNYAD